MAFGRTAAETIGVIPSLWPHIRQSASARQCALSVRTDISSAAPVPRPGDGRADRASPTVDPTRRDRAIVLRRERGELPSREKVVCAVPYSGGQASETGGAERRRLHH